MSHSNVFIRKILITESTGEQGVCVCVTCPRYTIIFIQTSHLECEYTCASVINNDTEVL